MTYIFIPINWPTLCGKVVTLDEPFAVICNVLTHYFVPSTTEYSL